MLREMSTPSDERCILTSIQFKYNCEVFSIGLMFGGSTMDHIFIEAKKLGKIKIKLYLDKAPKTCQKIEAALPFDVNLTKWGDELYGDIPVEIEPESPQEECEVGEVAYWLDGPAFCILFGRTPASKGKKPRLISPGNIFGKVEGDPSIFKQFDRLKIRLFSAK